MKLVFAQGNPGTDYAATRHNVGWIFLNAYAASKDVTFCAKSKFRAEIAEMAVGGEKCLLVKPLTFYNDTGIAARALADFYKLAPEDFLIIHDELALPIGTLRTRIGGSDAGNNGIKSLNAHLGSNSARLRIGIFDEESQRDALSSVLGTFTGDELEVLARLEPEVFKTIEAFLNNQFEPTTLTK